VRASSRENRRGLVEEDCVLSGLGLARWDYERDGASSGRLRLEEWRKGR